MSQEPNIGSPGMSGIEAVDALVRERERLAKKRAYAKAYAQDPEVIARRKEREEAKKLGITLPRKPRTPRDVEFIEFMKAEEEALLEEFNRFSAFEINLLLTEPWEDLPLGLQKQIQEVADAEFKLWLLSQRQKKVAAEYYKKHKWEVAEQQRERAKKYYAEHKEKHLAAMKEYRATLKGKEVQQKAHEKYYSTEENREKRRQRQREYQQRLRERAKQEQT